MLGQSLDLRLSFSRLLTGRLRFGRAGGRAVVARGRGEIRRAVPVAGRRRGRGRRVGPLGGSRVGKTRRRATGRTRWPPGFGGRRGLLGGNGLRRRRVAGLRRSRLVRGRLILDWRWRRRRRLLGRRGGRLLGRRGGRLLGRRRRRLLGRRRRGFCGRGRRRRRLLGRRRRRLL